MTDFDPDPPIPLSIEARRTWTRIATRIHGEGRWNHISQELLAVFCQTLQLYLECVEQVATHGVLVQGRTERELVRSPALTPLNQCRDALPKLARAVPLVDPSKRGRDGAEIDSLIDEFCR